MGELHHFEALERQAEDAGALMVRLVARGDVRLVDGGVLLVLAGARQLVRCVALMMVVRLRVRVLAVQVDAALFEVLRDDEANAVALGYCAEISHLSSY